MKTAALLPLSQILAVNNVTKSVTLLIAAIIDRQAITQLVLVLALVLLQLEELEHFQLLVPVQPPLVQQRHIRLRYSQCYSQCCNRRRCCKHHGVILERSMPGMNHSLVQLCMRCSLVLVCCMRCSLVLVCCMRCMCCMCCNHWHSGA